MPCFVECQPDVVTGTSCVGEQKQVARGNEAAAGKVTSAGWKGEGQNPVLRKGSCSRANTSLVCSLLTRAQSVV